MVTTLFNDDVDFDDDAVNIEDEDDVGIGDKWEDVLDDERVKTSDFASLK